MTITVSTTQKPVIESFNAEQILDGFTPTGSYTLSWRISGATSAMIDQGVGSVDPVCGDEGGDAGGDGDVHADGDERLWLIHEECDDYGIDDPEACDRSVQCRANPRRIHPDEVRPVVADQRRHVGHDRPGRGVGGPCLGDEGGDASGDDDIHADGDERLWLIHEKCDDYGIDDPEAGDRMVLFRAGTGDGIVHPVVADQRRHVGHDRPGRGVGGPCLGDVGR